MNDDNEKLKKDAEDLQAKTEERLLRAYVSSLLSTSPAIDKFSTWLLAGIGAAATLLITNIESISRIASFENIKWALLLLIVSGLFGVLEKYLALDIQGNLSQEKSLRDILAPLSADYQFRKSVIEGRAEVDGKSINVKIDIKKVLNQYAALHPWPIRKKIGRPDPLPIVLKKRVCCYYWQLVYAIIEIVLFSAFVLVIAFSV